MKRFLFFSCFLWASIFLWSSTASAAWVNFSSGCVTTFKTAEAESCSNYAINLAESYRANGTPAYVEFPSSTYIGRWVLYLWDMSGEIPPLDCSSSTMYCTSGIPQPVSCDSPNYIDVVSGECVPPETICYTTLESMAEECVLIEELDPDPGLNCVTNSTGNEICLNDNPECYQVDGKTFCPESDNVCGVKNGTFQCVDPMEEGCGYFNGEKVCFSPDGTKVDPTSPDHPDNGGNLDGDPTNDPTDYRDPAEGGDAENQPNQPIDTTDPNRASEQTAREQLTEQRNIANNTKASADSLKKIAEMGIKTDLSEELTQGQADSIIQNGATGSWDDPATGTWAGVDEHLDGISGNNDGQEYGTGMLDGITNTTTGLVQQGSCSSLGFNFKGHSFSIDCDKTKKIRDLLSWVFYVLTVWFLFDLVTTPVARAK